MIIIKENKDKIIQSNILSHKTFNGFFLLPKPVHVIPIFFKKKNKEECY